MAAHAATLPLCRSTRTSGSLPAPPPVITLATVVVIPDAAGIRFRAANRERELLDLPAPLTDSGKVALEQWLTTLGWAVRVTKRNVRPCYANLIAQAALLAVSLAALAYTRDFVPPWLAIVVAVGGVALLTCTLLRGTGIRYNAERAIRSSPIGDK
jgi:hypothetical protein